MKISGKFVAVLALLGSTVATAATVTVTPSVANNVPLGTFSVVVSGSGFTTATTGATLGISWNASVISLDTATFFSPDFNLATLTPTGTGTALISVITSSAAGVTGAFNAFTINATALSAGNANLTFIDDGLDLGWSDTSANLIEPMTYNQANIVVGTVPAPATVWLLATALGAVGFKAKRRLAKV